MNADVTRNSKAAYQLTPNTQAGMLILGPRFHLASLFQLGSEGSWIKTHSRSADQSSLCRMYGPSCMSSCWILDYLLLVLESAGKMAQQTAHKTVNGVSALVHSALEATRLLVKDARLVPVSKHMRQRIHHNKHKHKHKCKHDTHSRTHK